MLEDERAHRRRRRRLVVTPAGEEEEGTAVGAVLGAKEVQTGRGAGTVQT